MPRGVYDRQKSKVEATQEVDPVRYESDEEILARITETFDVLGKVTHGVINGNILSLIIGGAAGTGKSHLVIDALEREGKNHVVISGSISPVGLYKTLYEYSNEGDVVVLDDVEVIFSDMQSLDILKAALDTKKARTISWGKESAALRAEDIPPRFNFNGQVIFITNTDLAREVDRESRMSPHYNALLTRSIYVDLGIHTRREVMARVRQVLLTQEFMMLHGATISEVQAVDAWLLANFKEMRTLSIRSALQLLSLLRSSPAHWEQTARVTMLRRA